jgi:hypothetical protein
LSDDEANSDYTPHPAGKKVSTKTTRHPVLVKVEKYKKTKKSESNIKRLNNNNVRISDLPEFTQRKWRMIFLPTLYDKLFTSSQPFDNFLQNSDQFIALLQTIIKEVFPDINYEVTSSSSIQYLVCHFAAFSLAIFLLISSLLMFICSFMTGIQPGQ